MNIFWGNSEQDKRDPVRNDERQEEDVEDVGIKGGLCCPLAETLLNHLYIVAVQLCDF